MSPLSAALGDYLRLRRALGHKLDDVGRELARFAVYMDNIGAETVNMESALGFVLDPTLDPASSNPRRRLTAVRGFARYMSGIDPLTEIPPAGVVSYRPRRRTPHLFSDGEVATLAHSIRARTPYEFRKETLTTVVGLLAVTGMRVGEVLRLDGSDVDWAQAVILVRDTKFHKGRDVPVSASTIEALAAYANREDRPSPAGTRLFVSLSGTPVLYANLSKAFRDTVNKTGIGSSEKTRPRVHDLRHSFAVRTLVGWHRAGLDVEALLPRLSTYLGHREPRFTYTYLTATPELLGYAADRLEAAQAVAP
jgi:integrase/recombinase XerD